MLLKEKFHLKDTDAGQYSPLVLAYLGDAAYEILIRTIVVSEGNMQVNKLHKKSSSCEGCRPGGIPDGHRG